MITIGITGTIGAGKGTIVEYLKTKGFTHYSVRHMLLEEIDRRGIEPTRDSMFLVANDFRKISPGHIMEELLKKQQKNPGHAVIESQRALGEIKVLREKAEHFYLFAVDAPEKVRYERIKARNLSTDHVSFEKFVEDEKKEFENSEPWKTNLKACIKEADFVFHNNRKVEELYKEVEEVLQIIINS